MDPFVLKIRRWFFNQVGPVVVNVSKMCDYVIDVSLGAFRQTSPLHDPFPIPSFSSIHITFVDTLTVSSTSPIFVVFAKHTSSDVGDIMSMFKERHTHETYSLLM
jgi:hypothetical protein